MSRTACVTPWSSLIFEPDGGIRACCDMAERVTVDGQPGSIYRHSLEQLWNSDDLVSLREAMARGEKPACCTACWEREATGAISRRLLNARAYAYLGGPIPLEDLTREGADSGFRLERRPTTFVLELGNVCNLKCRSCDPLYSSRVASDPVQTRWVRYGAAPAAAAHPVRSSAFRLVPDNTPPWFENIDAMANLIESNRGDNLNLTLLGGEPFLIQPAWDLLRALVDRGISNRISVNLLTNGLQRRDELADLAPRFRQCTAAVSVDGYGALNEVLRHPGKWPRFVNTLRWLRDLPGLTVFATPTLQNANVLDIVRLLRFLDRERIGIGYNAVHWPLRLRPSNLPPNVRRVAAARLRAYLESDCPPGSRAVVRAYLEMLDAEHDTFEPKLFDEFMTFTNEMDAHRKESLRAAAPELAGLVRAAGIHWPEPGTMNPGAIPSPFERPSAHRRMVRTISPRDVLYPIFEQARPGAYFESGALQLATIDALLLSHQIPPLETRRVVVDFACGYGRIARALRAGLPSSELHVCDIDPEASQFCSEHFKALPVTTSWNPDDDTLPSGADALTCVSLFTHTPLSYTRRLLAAWRGMLKPGGIVAFTYLGEGRVTDWLVGAMEHYGTYTPKEKETTARSLEADGHGFVALGEAFGAERQYGIAFVSHARMRRELEAAGFEVIALPEGDVASFAQSLAIARRPLGSDDPAVLESAEPGAVRLVALFDPRGYAPEEAEGVGQTSLWTQVTTADPPRALPTEMGFADPRVAEVREAQAALAREHGIDAFCYLTFWGPTGLRWEAPLRDLLSSGRPDFPFCLLLTLEGTERVSTSAAIQIFDSLLPSLGDDRYLHLADQCLLLVRDLDRVDNPEVVAKHWREAARAAGLGELHLSACEATAPSSPQTFGFDSLFEAPPRRRSGLDVASSALTRPWPDFPFLRRVTCSRTGPPETDAAYEHWLHSARGATLHQGGSVLLLDAWNDWLEGHYLEPDDHAGRGALVATRRAVRGPASGAALVRRLRDRLGPLDEEMYQALAGLEEALASDDQSRQGLLATVEVALGRSASDRDGGSGYGPPGLSWVPAASHQLPPSPGAASLDCVGPITDQALRQQVVVLQGENVRFAGWADANRPPTEVELFVALESGPGRDRVFPVSVRIGREDVFAARPSATLNCGFDVSLDLSTLPPGTYAVAIVQ
jgi:MoaA/NifB/PqqE/SkfB family radical SAM enzyme/SAM-dependent methyltransferase